MVGHILKSFFLSAGMLIAESLLFALVISVIWFFLLSEKTGIYLNYLNWLGIVSIFKLLRFSMLTVDINLIKSNKDQDEIY